METTLKRMLDEMKHGPDADTVILQNPFEIWGRSIRRQIQPTDASKAIPSALVRVRRQLDADYRSIPPLDELVLLS